MHSISISCWTQLTIFFWQTSCYKPGQNLQFSGQTEMFGQYLDTLDDDDDVDPQLSGWDELQTAFKLFSLRKLLTGLLTHGWNGLIEMWNVMSWWQWWQQDCNNKCQMASSSQQNQYWLVKLNCSSVISCINCQVSTIWNIVYLESKHREHFDTISYTNKCINQNVDQHKSTQE